MASEAARHLASFRKRGPVTCRICGRQWEAQASAQYCSNACRQKAKYRRGRAPAPLSAAALAARLAAVDTLLAALTVAVPLDTAAGVRRCAYCGGLQTATTTQHTAMCPWAQALRYRATP